MLLSFDSISKSYGTKRALDGVSFVMHEGVYGLLGPNGAGKSTLLNILTGNLSPDFGTISFNGNPLRILGRDFRSRLGYMPQQQALYPGFSCESFLYYIASLRDMSSNYAQMRISKLLSELELVEVKHQPIRSLSGGMKQRLLLAQAMLNEPDVLVLDEPTAGLDPRQRIAVRNLIAGAALHKIVLLSTHVVSDVECIAASIILIKSGRVIAMDTPERLCYDMVGRVWEVDTDERHMPELRNVVSYLRHTYEGITLRLISDESPSANARLVKPSLEDVYLQFFGEEGTN